MKYRFIFALFLVLSTACKKAWFEIRSDKKITVPTTVEDLQALLDNPLMNNMNNGLQALNEIGADNYYLENTTFQTLQNNIRYQTNAYLFAPDIFEGALNVNVWNLPYQRIYYANVVLDELEHIPAADQQVWNNTKGDALFLRAYNHALLAEMFQKPYRAGSAAIDPGIPLRLHSDFNERTVRPTIQKVFDQIREDLQQALLLLPATAPYPTRPSQAAAYALLAREALITGDYEHARLFASQCLQRYSALMDFKTDVTPASTFSIKRYNAEVLFHDVYTNAFFSTTRAIIDTGLYISYNDHDLRKSVYFTSQPGIKHFRGSYDGSGALFGGITTSEVYLIRAESSARLGETSAAMNDLNTLLRKRWDGQFVPLQASNSSQALEKILVERRKELCFKALRWGDLRRLNQEADYQVTVKRVLNGQTYILTPNSSKYTYPIPDDIIKLTGIEQNEREQ
jgi:hypothetical protein